MFETLTSAATYLGPGRVLGKDDDGRFRLELGDEMRTEITAQIAIGFPYQPAEGDLLLVIGGVEAHYIIGVLQGKGFVNLAIPGNVELRAVGGTLELTGDKAVKINSPETVIRTGKLTMFANAVLQRFANVFQHVTGLFTQHAANSRRVIDDDDYSQAKNTTIVSAENSKLYGKTVHLGH